MSRHRGFNRFSPTRKIPRQPSTAQFPNRL
jgi:hypothetical protein